MKTLPLFLISLFLFNSRAHAQPVTLMMQRGQIAIPKFVFSRDGKYLVTAGSFDGQVKIWDMKTGKEYADLEGIQSPVYYALDVSRDSKSIATGDRLGYVDVWDCPTGLMRFSYHIDGGTIQAVKFDPTRPYVVVASENKSIYIFDVHTGNLLRTIPGYLGNGALCISDDGTSVYALGISDPPSRSPNNGPLCRWDVETGDRMMLAESFGSEIASMDAICLSPDGKFLYACTKDGTFIFNFKTKETIPAWLPRRGEGDHFDCMDLSPDGSLIAFKSDSGYISIVARATEKLLKTFRGGELTYLDFQTVAFTSDDKYVASTESDGISLWNLETGEKTKRFRGFVDGVDCLAWSTDHRYLFSGGTDQFLTKWDVASKKVSSVYPRFSGGLRCIRVSSDGKYLFTGEGGDTSHLWDPNNGSLLQSIPFGQVDAADFFPDSKRILFASNGGLYVWDIAGQRLNATMYAPGDSIARVCCGPSGTVYVVKNFGPIMAFDGRTLKKMHEIPFGDWGVSMALSPNERELLVAGNQDSLFAVNLRTWTLEFSVTGFKNGIGGIAFSPNGATFVVSSGNGTFTLCDAFTGKVLTTRRIHDEMGTTLFYTPNGKWLYSAGDDGCVTVSDSKTLSTELMYVRVGASDYIVVNKDNYYTCTPRARDAIAFKYGEDIFPFEQFDLKYNRPDLVLQGPPASGKAMQRAYNAAYQKRLEKLGFTEAELSADFHLPTLNILSTFASSTQQQTIPVRLAMNDSLYKLKVLRITVNGVPLFGSRGISLRPTNSVEQTVDIPLSVGRNFIECSVLNDKGAESLKESFEISCENERPVPQNTYIVAIGVSGYQDSQYDLTYAAKDAEDLAAAFQRANPSAVKTLVIADARATRENIRKAREFLMQSTVDDEAIVFFAGHGLLDNKLDYYLGTTDVDFENPALRGLAYEDLEGLLDGIPARKKLLLVDACHAGEVDKGSSALVAENSKSAAGVTSRGFKSVISTDQSLLGLKDSFDLMQDLFANLEVGSGAVVIASASGKEFAYESNEWRNGVFTYALLEGLKSKSADRNGDGRITVSELKDYVTQRVQFLTGGKQTPTSRRENLDFDFRVW